MVFCGLGKARLSSDVRRQLEVERLLSGVSAPLQSEEQEEEEEEEQEEEGVKLCRGGVKHLTPATKKSLLLLLLLLPTARQ